MMKQTSEKPCRICGSLGPHQAWTVRDLRGTERIEYTYFKCASCGCLQNLDMPSDASGLYTSEYYSLKAAPERKRADNFLKGLLRRSAARVAFRKNWHERLKKIFTLPTHHEWFVTGNATFSSAILDVGCGSGELLLRVAKEGFRGAMGLEPFLDKDITYPNGLRIRKGSMGDLAGRGLFDFMMLNHSLEHMIDQHEAFGHITRLLKDEGTAMVRVPMGTSLAWDEYGADWVQLDPPRHLYLHSEESIRLLAAENGLQVFKTVYDSWEFQFVGSELCRAGVPIEEHKGYLRKNEPFDKATLRGFRLKAMELNETGKGDMACFYLRKAQP
ncbi:MAG TPA: hypothetical protein DDW94_07680 [Deltaproteobacteria bacterium]|nr:hypothetical protein [Deltaproteobacteria bacterium]HCY11088.1 hypothetical protein [Deltaproteobacteria bacterium]